MSECLAKANVVDESGEEPREERTPLERLAARTDPVMRVRGERKPSRETRSIERFVFEGGPFGLPALS